MMGGERHSVLGLIGKLFGASFAVAPCIPSTPHPGAPAFLLLHLHDRFGSDAGPYMLRARDTADVGCRCWLQNDHGSVVGPRLNPTKNFSWPDPSPPLPTPWHYLSALPICYRAEILRLSSFCIASRWPAIEMSNPCEQG